MSEVILLVWYKLSGFMDVHIWGYKYSYILNLHLNKQALSMWTIALLSFYATTIYGYMRWKVG